MHHLQDIYSNHYLLDLVRSSFILTSMQRAKEEHKVYYGLLYHKTSNTVIILKILYFLIFLLPKFLPLALPGPPPHMVL